MKSSFDFKSIITQPYGQIVWRLKQSECNNATYELNTINLINHFFKSIFASLLKKG